ncbi:alpha/beta hydrolase family protein [Brevibacillus borstelensis]|uniref:alpha/beta hydrolase family protein n=1 Tax=Brevibacillus borstelensis TaxID=45462 RepID=UPI0030C1269B
MFLYDKERPLSWKEHSVAAKEGYSVRDIAYDSPLGGEVPAYLVTPEGKGCLPAVLFLHPGQGNRASFLPEAERLATQGIVSLSIDAPFLRQALSPELSQEERAVQLVEMMIKKELFVQTIVDLQRGVDLLVSLDNVDAERIGYVGHSYGATWGGVFAGVEKRVKAYVLMAGYSRSTVWHRTSGHPVSALVRQILPKERFERVFADLEELDAVHYIKNAAPAPVLFQFVHHDEFIDREQADQYMAAASSPREVKWYESDHLFTGCEEAEVDRREWLLRQLG